MTGSLNPVSCQALPQQNFHDCKRGMRKLRAKALSDVYVSKEIITVSSKLITFFGPCGCLLDFFRLPCEERVFGKNKLLN